MEHAIVIALAAALIWSLQSKLRYHYRISRRGATQNPTAARNRPRRYEVSMREPIGAEQCAMIRRETTIPNERRDADTQKEKTRATQRVVPHAVDGPLKSVQERMAGRQVELVASALVNLGCQKGKATEAARTSVAGGGSFDEQFRRALQMVTI